MTLALLNQIGIESSFEGNTIKVNPCQAITNFAPISIESDWSSASYWYSIVALSNSDTGIILFNYKKNSLQGDAALAQIYKHFGVQTVFNNNESITISKTEAHSNSPLSIDLNNCPDIAQTIAVTCFGLKIGCYLTGLETLKIKETDRLAALYNELGKLGATINVTNDSLHLQPSDNINNNVTIATYQDHRMAMAFAPLALKTNIIIENAEVVSKSYPTFWNDLKRVCFEVDAMLI
jgi:3-phosphoshikimate 1-carboxyvinyltransferase